MRLTDRWYVVGGGDAGFGLSGRLDANCYLVDTGAGLWLFDVGFDSAERILANIEAEGLNPAEITHVFLTHHHADHAGAAAAIRERLGDGVQFAIGAPIAAGVRAGDMTANGYSWAQEVGFYPADVTLTPCPIDIEVIDGLTVEAGGTKVTAVATPGHCAGHTSYLVEGAGATVLISGDQVFWGGKILLQNLPDVNLGEYADSMSRLAALDFEVLLPGHGGVSLSYGRRHVEQAQGHFSQIGVPPGLF